jgi:hypothetical protein
MQEARDRWGIHPLSLLEDLKGRKYWVVGIYKRIFWIFKQ